MWEKSQICQPVPVEYGIKWQQQRKVFFRLSALPVFYFIFSALEAGFLFSNRYHYNQHRREKTASVEIIDPSWTRYCAFFAVNVCFSKTSAAVVNAKKYLWQKVFIRGKPLIELATAWEHASWNTEPSSLVTVWPKKVRLTNFRDNCDLIPHFYKTSTAFAYHHPIDPYLWIP